MKKMYLLLFTSFITINVFSQTADNNAEIALDQARVLANSKGPRYKPTEAFNAFNKLALSGNAEAMNDLGMLYSQGIGTPVNDQQAKYWFKKSAKNGYPGAFYNLALIYKNGIGVLQDLATAYDYFNKGAALSNHLCMYGQGYMLYKGLGVAQNYEQAVELFKKAANLHDEGSYYMLGLCYRNGYGVVSNLDSAKYWLKKAAGRGDQRAVLELASNTGENLKLTDVPNLQPTTPSTHPVDLKTGFKQIAHHLTSNNLQGDYTGYVIKFDWSGKYIIGQADLKLHLTVKANDLSGQWEEKGQEPVSISGTMADTAVIFNNTNFKLKEHYHNENPLAVIFKNAHFNLITNKDTVYLTGTLRLYSPQTRESQKPEFIMLIRTGAQPDLTINKPDSLSTKADSLNFSVYPNPFVNQVQIKYTLKKAANVSVIITSLFSGAIVYRGKAEQLMAGDHTNSISFNGRSETYIITLQYGGRIKSATIIKQ